MTGSVRHFLDVTDLSPDEIGRVLDLAEAPVGQLPRVLAGMGAALIFEKPSLRTRHSTEMAVVQLGGHPVYTRGEEIGFDTRETVEDATRVLAGYHGLVAARVFHHDTVARMAAVDAVPVVNLLSDRAHPLQALTDLLTMRQLLGPLRGRAVAWVGDYNNVARSLAEAVLMQGGQVRLGCPEGYGPDAFEIERLALIGAGELTVHDHAVDAAKGAAAVHTDVWTSMGQEAESEARRRAFDGWQVTDDVMAAAAPEAVFLHCLPAHRGEEVAASVIDGPRSHVFGQGHNRLHAARGLLAHLLGEPR